MQFFLLSFLVTPMVNYLGNPTTTDYVTLSGMYKQLVNRRKRELYTRYGDIFRGKIDKLVDIGPMDVLYVVLMNSATAMIGMCFTVLVHGSSVINNGALLYELFCFLLDVYLRFSPDATDFLCGVPILNRYTVFELIEFMRSCRVIFMYYSNIMGNDKKEVQLKSAMSVVRNNVAAIQVLDNHITTMNAMLTSKPTSEDSDIAWRGSPTVEKNYEEIWNAAILKSVDKSKFTNEVCWIQSV
uniref:Uncharacterized protein n=1 Tax=Babesia bovis TaxID=5865 RepID=A7ANP7_BABBO|eukprot:XP_001611749.1 hypothetical protein [Babesia bovis T2Bo]